MARVENHPKVILTQEEVETLRQTQDILTQIATEDIGSYIYDSCDNSESEFWWIDKFIENLVNISEKEINN